MYKFQNTALYTAAHKFDQNFKNRNSSSLKNSKLKSCTSVVHSVELLIVDAGN